VGDRFVWPALFLLGLLSRPQSGMGWLFAVAIGFQERRTIAVGSRNRTADDRAHSLRRDRRRDRDVRDRPASARRRASRRVAILIGFGVYRLVRTRHLRWVGMRVGFWGLVLWGFLMSSAHRCGIDAVAVRHRRARKRAGAMAMPMPMVSAVHGAYAIGWLMVTVHTLGYLLTTTGWRYSSIRR